MKLIDSIASRFGFIRKGQRPIVIRSTTGFNAGENSRLLADWNNSDQSVDSILRSQLRTIRTRSRHMARNDDYARKFLHLLKNNVVGPNGIALQMDVRDPDGTQDSNACDQIEEAWYQFGRRDNFTTAGTLSRQETEGMIVETVARDGECIIRKVRGFDNPFRYSLQLIEADYLDHDYNATLKDGRKIVMGVEFDRWRKPIAYHFLTRNANDVYASMAGGAFRERVPASDIIHAFVKISIEQSRGVSWLAVSLASLKMLNGFEEAALVAARVGASKMGFFEQMPDASGQYQGDGLDADGNIDEACSPGEFRTLPQGVKFSAFDPSYPHTEHGSFTKAILRRVSSGLGVSYNSLGNDLEGVNYSSIRAGLLEDRDAYRTLQSWLISSLHEVIFPEWLQMSLLSGAIQLPASKFEKFNRPVFKGRSWQWVDPMKDTEAHVEAIRNNLTTHGDVIAMQGGDFEEVMRRTQREREIAKAYGVNLNAESNTKEKRPEKEDV